MDDFSFTLNTVNKHAIYFQHVRLMTPSLWGRGEGEQIKPTCNIQHWTQDQIGRPKVHKDNTRQKQCVSVCVWVHMHKGLVKQGRMVAD